MLGPIGRGAGAVADLWRRSLRFRVVAATVVGSTVVLGLIVPALLSQIARGVLEAKERSVLAEATAARSEAQRLVDATSDTGESLSPARRVDAVVAAVAARGAGTGLFEVLALSSEPAGLGLTPERGTNLVSEASVPAGLREVVSGSQRQAWAYTTIRYTDGASLPGIIVGAPLEIRGIGPYELYQLFPLTTEESTLSLVRNDTTVAGLLLVAGLAGLAALVTFTFVRPVNETARAARRLASGDLDVRIPVRGQDDLAKLARSFNEMADSLETYIGQLQDLSQMQQRFVADVSHELRTPMTTLRMAADLLHDNRATLPPDDARAVELLSGQIDRFEALLSDLLEVSRSDAGAVSLEWTDTDLVALVGSAVAGLAPLAAEQGCRVIIEAPAQLSVRADRARVERILANLIANALEYGSGKPVLVVVERDPDATVDPPDALVRVIDHGVGLSPEQFQAVFERFWRADPARSRRIGGTGLGLAIARGDARAHGGEITAWGELGAGATFELRLPGTPPAAALTADAPARAGADRGADAAEPTPAEPTPAEPVAAVAR